MVCLQGQTFLYILRPLGRLTRKNIFRFSSNPPPNNSKHPKLGSPQKEKPCPPQVDEAFLFQRVKNEITVKNLNLQTKQNANKINDFCK